MKVKILRNNKGNALLLVILAIALITVVGLGLLKITSNTNKMTVNERDDQTIFYFAEAGVNLEKTKVEKVVRALDVEIKETFNNLTMDEQNQLLTENDSIETYYYKQIKEKFCTKYKETYGTNECASTYDLTDQYSKHPKADTTVRAEDDGKIIIDSTGYFAGQETKARKVRQELKLNTTFQMNNSPTGGNETGGNGGNSGETGNENPLKEFAVITKNGIYMQDSNRIKGSAGTISAGIDIKNIENISGNMVTDNLTYPDWFKYNSDTMKKINEKKQPTSNYFENIKNDFNQYFQLPFPDEKFNSFNSIPLHPNQTVKKNGSNYSFIENGKLTLDGGGYNETPTLTLSNATRFTSFKLDSNLSMNINIGSNNVDLYIEDFQFLNGTINVIGSGTLDIYVKNLSNLGAGSKLNADPSKVNIYYYPQGNGSNKNLIINYSIINSSFYVKKSSVTFGGGSSFVGNIFFYNDENDGFNLNFGNDVKTNGQWIVAPNADIEFADGKIKGVVIAKSLVMNGASSIEFLEPIVPNPAIPTTSKFILETDTSDPLFNETLIEVDK